MRAIVQTNRSAADFQTMDIGHLAEFLNITIHNLDELNAQEKAALLKQLVAISQMKLTRLTLQH